MKIVYIAPKINDSGGVARILSLKANYLVEQLGHEVHIITQNGGSGLPFYSFSQKIILHDKVYARNKLNYLWEYRKYLQNKLLEIQADVIVMADNGLKAFLFPMLLKSGTPTVLELHRSRFNMEMDFKGITKLVYTKAYDALQRLGAKKFGCVVALSDESLSEWELSGKVIPNPNWLRVASPANVDGKRAITITRPGRAKGLDRLLLIWREAVAKHPGWMLDVYGIGPENVNAIGLARELGVLKNVAFYEATRHIEQKYQQSSLYLMASRSEAFPMVLIEAMASGLPVIAYDCPTGPRAILTDGIDGFLIEDGQISAYTEKLFLLMEDAQLRRDMGNRAYEQSGKYDLDLVMKRWEVLFRSFER